MTLSMAGSTKAQIAMGTLEGFGARVQPHVDFETAGGGEKGTADVTANVF